MMSEEEKREKEKEGRRKRIIPRRIPNELSAIVSSNPLDSVFNRIIIFWKKEGSLSLRVLQYLIVFQFFGRTGIPSVRRIPQEPSRASV